MLGQPARFPARTTLRRPKYTYTPRTNLCTLSRLQIVASPFLAALAVSIGAPVLLCYVYGVVPVAMCRSRGCGVLNAAQWLSLDDLDGLDGPSADKRTDNEQDGVSLSHRGVVVNPSIGEVSISLGSGSHLERLGRDGEADAEGSFAYPFGPFGPDREDQSVSNVAIAGTSLTGASLAGSIAGVSGGQGQRCVLPWCRRPTVDCSPRATRRLVRPRQPASCIHGRHLCLQAGDRGCCADTPFQHDQ